MIFKKKVTKEMVVTDVVTKVPVAREIIIRNGIKFSGAGMNPLESLDKLLKANGLNEEEINNLIAEINSDREDAEFKMILTKNAANRLAELLQQKEMNAVKLRFFSDGVATNIYDLDFTNQKTEEEIETSALGLKFFIEKKSASFLKGTTIDYDKLEDSFVFNNPNIKKR